MPRLTVVVVTYNARPFLPDLLASLEKQTFRDFELVVVDNASKDRTAEAFPSWARVFAQSENTGFAKGCNIGMRMAAGEIFFLLNQDTVLDSRCLEELVRTMDASPNAGLCGAKMLFWHEPEILNSFGFESSRFLYCWDRGMFEFDEGQYDSHDRVPGACGGALAIRRSVLDRIGGFDEAYFMYHEDVDLCIRAIRAGYDVALAPGAKVYHKQTFEGQPPAFQNYLSPRNRFRTVIKNLGLPVLIWVVLGHVVYEGLVIGHALLHGRFLRAWGRTGAILRILLDLPRTWAFHERIMRLRGISDVALLARLGRGWRPEPRIRMPDYPGIWLERAERMELPRRVEPGAPEPSGLGYGWGAIRHAGRRRTRSVRARALVYLGQGEGDQLAMSIRSEASANGDVFVNGLCAGQWRTEGAQWQDWRSAPLQPQAVNRILIRCHQGEVNVEWLEWTPSS